MPLQILRIGQFFLLCIPGEFTTMAGRRIRNAVREAIIANGGPSDAVVVISGLSNSYASYITTFEEYQVTLSPPDLHSWCEDNLYCWSLGRVGGREG